MSKLLQILVSVVGGCATAALYNYFALPFMAPGGDPAGYMTVAVIIGCLAFWAFWMPLLTAIFCILAVGWMIYDPGVSPHLLRLIALGLPVFVMGVAGIVWRKRDKERAEA